MNHTFPLKATSDQTTGLALTNHSYFNLSGNLKDTILNHHVTIKSKRFGKLNKTLMPTGKLLNVEGTTFDFRKGKKLHKGIASRFKEEQNRRIWF
jgi:aldose 1-epimerase